MRKYQLVDRNGTIVGRSTLLTRATTKAKRLVSATPDSPRRVIDVYACTRVPRRGDRGGATVTECMLVGAAKRDGRRAYFSRA